MKKLYLLLAILFSAYQVNAQCMSAPYGQYPTATFVPANTGSNETILADSWPGEYSRVTVQPMMVYTFSTSVPTDYITITTASNTLLVHGTSPVTWVNLSYNGDVKYILHTNAQCGTEYVGRGRYIRATSAVCDAPTGISATNVGAHNATFSWTAVPGTNVEGYQIMTSELTDYVPPASLPVQITTTGTSITQATLTQNRSYKAWIRTVCSGGIGGNWVSVSFTTTSGVGCPTAPFGVYPAGIFVPQCTGAEEVILEDAWAGEATRIASIPDRRYTYTSGVATDVLTIRTDAGVLLASGLSPVIWNSGTYNGIIRFFIHTNTACGTDAIGRRRAITCAPVSCGSPSGITYSNITSNSASVSWTAGSPAPANYQYYISNYAPIPYDGVGTDTGLAASGETQLADLNGGTTYYVYVRSLCGNVPGPWISGGNFVTKPALVCNGANYGLFPSNTFTPFNTGINEVITSNAWAGQFSNVNVSQNVNYVFLSSAVNDFITITNAEGTEVYVSGTTPVQWNSGNVSGNVRYFLHANGSCDNQKINRSKYIKVCETAPPVATDQNVNSNFTVSSLVATGQNLQWYNTATGGTSLSGSTPVTTATYYVSQTINGCESTRVSVAVTATAGNVVYVKHGATGYGTSWDDASANLKAMIDGCIPGMQVWVAEGTYLPTEGTSYSMKEGVAIYGGFAAAGTPGMSDRNYNTNITILQGNGNSVISNQNNGLTNAAILDGFTIRNGAATGNGGGINNVNAFPAIANCIFYNNQATNWGGALYNEGDGVPKLTNCVLYNNTSSGGGAIFENIFARGDYVNCTISNNHSTQNGGGVHTYNNAFPTFKNCIIWGNTANSSGKQVFTLGASSNALLTYTLVPDGENDIVNPTTQNNIVNDDPQFTNAGTGDFTLQLVSPAINMGNAAFFANVANVMDLAGNERLSGPGIDMGAYEYKFDCTIATTWDGTNWSNGTPVSNSYSVTINGHFDSAVNGNITACSLTVNSGDVVIAEGDNFTLKGAVTVDNDNATFTIEHNANLIQRDEVDNVGTITVVKESAPMYRLDYALWSSPVAGQKLKAFSPQTLDNRFYTYNPLSDAYATVQAPATTDFAEGKGYLIRVDNTHPAYVEGEEGTPWEGSFEGVPHNGTANVAVIPQSEGVKGFNAIGNPYPSSINIEAFFEANQSNLSNISPIYFWRKKNEAGTSSYASLTLAGYNANSGNDFGDSSNGVFANANDSGNWVINPGQGFIVRAVATTVTFNNQMRRAVNNGQMFRSAMDASDKSRLWLNLTNAEGAFGQTTIAYTPATTPGLDFGWDGQAMTDGEVAVYSLAGDVKLGIQARPAFDVADEVPLGYKITTAGTYSISLDHVDGVFAEGQDIYLRDNLMGGTTHNLSESAYEFATETGITTGRFDVVYAEALGTPTSEFDANSIIVYTQGGAINISSGTVDMKAVQVYDIRSRLLYSSDNINAAETSITTLEAQEQMLIVRITSVDGAKADKKILY